MELLDQQFKSLGSGLTAAELDIAKHKMRAALAQDGERSLERCMTMGWQYLVNGQVLSSADMTRMIEKVNRDDVARAASVIISGSPMTAGFGRLRSIAPQLAKL
jgi:predicted Zn-dependent peptidase